MVKVITPVVEAPFGFFEVGEEGVGANAAQPRQSGFGVTPKRFDAVDVAASPGKFILAVVDSVVFIALKNQTITSTPTIGEDRALAMLGVAERAKIVAAEMFFQDHGGTGKGF